MIAQLAWIEVQCRPLQRAAAMMIARLERNVKFDVEMSRTIFYGYLILSEHQLENTGG
jgi:hypothetical protein